LERRSFLDINIFASHYYLNMAHNIAYIYEIA
jgi:hypothetical protein